MRQWLMKIVIDKSIGWIVGIVLVAASAKIVDYVTNGSLIRRLGGNVAWVDDQSKPGNNFETECEYRWKLQEPFKKPYSMGESPPHTLYATSVSHDVILYSYRNGFFAQFSNEDRGKIWGPEGDKTVQYNVQLQKRC